MGRLKTARTRPRRMNWLIRRNPIPIKEGIRYMPIHRHGRKKKNPCRISKTARSMKTACSNLCLRLLKNRSAPCRQEEPNPFRIDNTLLSNSDRTAVTTPLAVSIITTQDRRRESVHWHTPYVVTPTISFYFMMNVCLFQNY